ncbi:MAG: DUF3127 domain-containing protein [Flavobacterium sp.]
MMQIKAKLIELLPLQTGESKNGTWKKQSFVVETDAQYPKKICFSLWGDKIQEIQNQSGNFLLIDFEMESRYYQGKWYTDLKATKISIPFGSSSQKENIPTLENDISQGLEPELSDLEDDDLPF